MIWLYLSPVANWRIFVGGCWCPYASRCLFKSLRLECPAVCSQERHARREFRVSMFQSWWLADPGPATADGFSIAPVLFTAVLSHTKPVLSREASSSSRRTPVSSSNRDRNGRLPVAAASVTGVVVVVVRVEGAVAAAAQVMPAVLTNVSNSRSLHGNDQH